MWKAAGQADEVYRITTNDTEAPGGWFIISEREEGTRQVETNTGR